VVNTVSGKQFIVDPQFQPDGITVGQLFEKRIHIRHQYLPGGDNGFFGLVTHYSKTVVYVFSRGEIVIVIDPGGIDLHETAFAVGGADEIRGVGIAALDEQPHVPGIRMILAALTAYLPPWCAGRGSY